ncbi:MAG: YlxM family DNA-binding protein [Acetatifactor sp.]|nr:YlxM family DNA-binding protein [Acetatifactor sp.]
MDRIFERTLLYDFYGELLTPHQQNIYECVVFDDMSLGEVAEEQGISRQGVHDLIKRCDKILQEYERKLHLVERFSGAREKIAGIVELTREDAETSKKLKQSERMERIRKLSEELMKEW